MANVQYLDPFNGVFGLPPSSWISDEMIINSMPVLEITPAIPKFESGLNLFSVSDASTEYAKILANHGYSTPMPIRCAFLADNFPTDSFTNDYGETFLQKFTDVASQGMSQLAQMTGSTTGTDALQKIGGSLSNLGEDMGGVMGSMMSGAGGMASGAGGGIKKLTDSMKKNESNGLSSVMGGGINLIDKMIGGHRVDFPQVWRNSGFTPSYTATIRLYNPNPGSKQSTDQHIIGPLAVLLCLAVPRSDDGRTYNWPYFHKVKATGIYNLDPAVITNITIVKGGDQQQISYNQKLAMVDVRIDFASLYGSMLVEEGTKTFTNRPTVRSYLKSLSDDDESLYTKRDLMNQVTGAKAGAGDILSIRTSQLSREEQNQIAKNEAAKQRQAPTVTEVVAGNRVPTNTTQTQAGLEDRSDHGFVKDTID